MFSKEGGDFPSPSTGTHVINEKSKARTNIFVVQCDWKKNPCIKSRTHEIFNYYAKVLTIIHFPCLLIFSTNVLYKAVPRIVSGSDKVSSADYISRFRIKTVKMKKTKSRLGSEVLIPPTRFHCHDNNIVAKSLYLRAPSEASHPS